MLLFEVTVPAIVLVLTSHFTLVLGSRPFNTNVFSVPSNAGPLASTDGTCGNGVTCAGSTFGRCCSEYGYCGNTEEYCGAGCNPVFGSCDTQALKTESSLPGSSPIAELSTTNMYTPVSTVISIIWTTAISSLLVTSTSTAIHTSTQVVTSTLTRETFATKTISIASTFTVPVTSVVTVNSTNAVEVQSIRTVDVPITSYISYQINVTSQFSTTSTKVLTKVETVTVSILSTLAKPPGPAVQISTITIAQFASSTSVIIQLVTSTVLETETTTVTKSSTAVTTLSIYDTNSTPPPSSLSSSSTSTSLAVTNQSPSPTFPGTSETCSRYYQTQDEDSCSELTRNLGVSQDVLLRLNPSLSTAGGENSLCEWGDVTQLLRGSCKVDCSDLWAGYFICLAD